MILWLTGQTGAGKTTLAKKLATGPNTVILDGDEVREVWTDLTMSYKDRWEQNMRVARLAKMLEAQGLTVIVAVICPLQAIRDAVKTITNCDFIYIKGGHKVDEAHPYEPPEDPLMIHERKHVK